MYALFALVRFDPHAPALVAGEVAFARAAGFKSPRHFAERYLIGASSSSVLVQGVLSEHGPYGHWYLVNRQPVTHPGSASVMGERIRAATAAARRARTPGWSGQRAEPSTPVPDLRELPVAISLPSSIVPDELFQLTGRITDKPGSDSESSA